MKKLKRRYCAVLPLVLKGKWYAMIASGEKKEEYRELKPYWENRIANWHARMDAMGAAFAIVRFQMGYQKNAPYFYRTAMHLGHGDFRQHFEIRNKAIHPEWGEPSIPHYVLKLGERFELEE